MLSVSDIIHNIQKINYDYTQKYEEGKIAYANHDDKLLFEHDNYLKIIVEQVLPMIYARQKTEKESLEQYFKLMKPTFLNEIKKELSRMEKEEKNFELNLKNDLSSQLNRLNAELKNYNEKTERDKQLQKTIIEDFFVKNKPNFLVIIKANIELGLSLARDSQNIYFQFIFFKAFSDLFQAYLNSLNKTEELTRIVKTYFYYSELNMQKYYDSNDLTTKDELANTRNSMNKINIRMVKASVLPEVYLSMKKICLKNK